MTRAFITGITGQDGAYLAKLLLDKGYDVIGGTRHLSSSNRARLRTLGIEQEINFVELDLSSLDSIRQVIQDHPVDEFYNLAAQSFVGASWVNPLEADDINGFSVLRLLDSLQKTRPETRFYQASTSEIYGRAVEVPQTETTRFHPRAPYGVAKVYGHYTIMNYRESLGAHASCGILFNHESPLRGSEFVTRKITLGLAKYARGISGGLELGNLSARRDWGYAGDYVEGMWRMLQQDKADDYVLATGITTSIRDFVSLAASALDLQIDWEGEGLTEKGIDRKTGRTLISVNEQFFRPNEATQLVGNPEKARQQLGWTAKVGVAELAEMMAKADYDELDS
ncbi:GDP-mannose 4,6-dehydratase [Rhodovibrionaceae bacterium A322]